jgi:antitoxin component HigA of HigAB toxin-antitoxin module
MTSKEEHRRQVDLLMQDIKNAIANQDHEGGCFAILQMFKLNKAYHDEHGIRPSPAQVAMFEDLLKRDGRTLEELEQQMEYIYTYFGEKFPR